MSIAATMSGALARVLLGLAREGTLALNRIPVTSAGDPMESVHALAKLTRELVAEGVLSAEDLSEAIGVEYVGEFGPELCIECNAILDFGQRGDGPGEADPEAGINTCSDRCRHTYRSGGR